MASIEELEKREKYADTLTDQFLGTQIEKKLLGERYVRFGPLVNTSAFLFQEGALVGGAYAKRFATFAIPFFAFKKSQEAAEFYSTRLGLQLSSCPMQRRLSSSSSAMRWRLWDRPTPVSRINGSRPALMNM